MSTHAPEAELSEAEATELPVEEWASCSLCRVRSPLTTAFRLHRRKQRLCPACYRNEQSRTEIGTVFTVGFWLTLASLAVLLGAKGSNSWGLLNLALLPVMQWLTVLPHEFGHALAARAMGLEVLHIIVGVGRRIGSWRIGGTRIDLHLLPLGGATCAEVRDQRWMRARMLCLIAAGPLVNGLLLWTALDLGRDAWLAEQFMRGPAPLFTFIVANIIVLVLNLWPRSAPAGRSDGALLLQFMFKRVDFAELQRATTLYRIQLDAMRGHPAEAIVRARAAALVYPHDAPLQILLSAALLNACRFAEARQLLLELLRDPAHRGEIKAVLQNNLAWANLNLDDAALGSEALSLATQAHCWMPWEPCLIANLGCAEAFFGNGERALELLANPRIAAYSPELQAHAASARALAHARLGNLAASQAALLTARRAYPSSHLLTVVERHLGEHTLPARSSATPACGEPKRDSC